MLEVRDIYKDYDQKPLLRGVSFSVNERETVCLLGPSGSGKSTLLKIIAGLEKPKSGQVLWDGNDLADVPVHKRQFGLMFQDFALFPHRSVVENVAFGLQMQNLPKAEVETRSRAALEQVEMLSFAQRKVTDLSGGEQQRVALARTLAPQPRLIMLDEPLGALDRSLREQLTRDLRRQLTESGIPAIYVTHDQEEAFAIADRLVLLHEGQVAESGTPQEVYQQPASTWVARFLGLTNLLEGEVISTNPLKLQTPLGVLPASSPLGKIPTPGEKATLLLSPIMAELEPSREQTQRINGMVEDSLFRGGYYQVRLVCGGSIHLEFNLDQDYPPGSELSLYLPPKAILCLA
jgi:spermidine/putrescine transport system ATP-binding protein